MSKKTRVCEDELEEKVRDALHYAPRLNFRLKYFDVEKMRDKVPKYLMSELPLLLGHSALVV